MKSASLPPSGHRKLKILLVRSRDDAVNDAGDFNDTGDFNDIEDRLTEAGHHITSTLGGHDAARALRHRPVNLVLVEGQSAANVLDAVAGLRSDNGRLSARYTPIFVLSTAQSSSLPPCIDGRLTLPLDCDALVSAYLEFLSRSLNDFKQADEKRTRCEVGAAIDRLGGDVELYKDLVSRFLEDSAGTVRQLETACERRDASLLHRAAHSLKGLAASVGAVSVAGVLGELEALGRSEDLDNLPSLWQRFQTESERSADELAPYHRRNHINPPALQ